MEYCEQQYDHKFDNLGEINLLTNHKLSKLNRDEIDNPNSPTIIKEIEFIKWKFMKKKSLGSDGHTGEFYWTRKEELRPILYNFFLK